ncbi:MAG TPA: ABC transporter substrate-binding protein [Kofleriaceae bacterium]|nr:ABC transporter substrate-binding protein [Kofleriaceae bacterium]
MGSRLWLVLFAAVALLSCDELAPQSGHGGAAATDTGSGPIRIGHFGSMTGSEATFGQSTDRGVRLAIAERNAKGGVHGRQLEVITLDDAGKSQEAGTTVTRLITERHVVAVLGEVASSLSLAGGRVAQQYGVPMISPSSTNATVTQIGDMISRVCFIDDFQGYVVAKFARDFLHASRVGVLYDQQQAYSKGLAKNFEAAFTELGGTITTSQAYTGGDADVSAQLQSLKDTSPEAIFLPGYYTDAGNIARQARKLGITVPLLGGDGWDSEKLTEIGGDAIEGSYYANHYSFEETRPAVENFVAKYKDRYGSVPDGLAALGYDAAGVLMAAMDRSPSLAGNDLAAAIAQTKDYPGVTGKITLDKNRDPVKSAVVLEVHCGQPRYVATIVPPGEQAPMTKMLELPPCTGAPHQQQPAAAAPEPEAGSKLLQTLVNSLALGALYALIALGYTLVYGVLRFINFAHSDVFTLGAWSSFALATAFGWGATGSYGAMAIHGITVLVLAMAICATTGVSIYYFAYRPLRRAPRLNVLITAIGVSLLLENTGTLPWAFGPNPQHMPPLVADASLVTIAGVHLRLVDTIVLVLALALVGGLQWLVYGTRMGRAMRAVSFDEKVASLMGIDVDRVVTLTFAIGSALAAAGGLLFALKYESLQITAHSTWILLGLTAFVAAVVGGIGDVRGAAIGALLIAAVQEFGAAYLSTQLRDIYVFTILIVVLLVRPTGLFGRVTPEKV